jgi:hypothetical protein
VPEHSLPDGKRWIANLLELGRALGYRVEGEYNVAPEREESAPVDVAWLRSTIDRFPLFIFEIETRPSGQMTYNAAKVFGQDTKLFEKPLFHFHIVLTGGTTSGRLKAGRNMFGKFNYRVYQARKAKKATKALRDIISEHRRVESKLDVARLADALGPEDWPELDLDRLWTHIERCDFAASFERDYAALSQSDPGFLPRLERRLAQRVRDRDDDSEQYRSPLARGCAPLMHAVILGLLEAEQFDEAFAALRDWQGPPACARVGPPFQQSADDHDDLVLAHAPAAWAALAGAVNTMEVRVWALAQLELTLGPADRRIPLALSGCAASWMLHVARTGGDDHRQAFDRAADHIRAGGGLPAAMMRQPPGRGALMADLEAAQARLEADAVPPPGWGELTGTTTGDVHSGKRLLAGVTMTLSDDVSLPGVAVLDVLWGSGGGEAGGEGLADDHQ